MSPKDSKDKIVESKSSILVQKTDLSLFDDKYSNMKERFAARMRRMDNEMTKFSKELKCLYGQSTRDQASVTQELSATIWENITKSPLIQGEGEAKMLMLQFDVSQFEPSEVKVKIKNDQLIVLASHKSESEGSTVSREYKREVLLPSGIDPKAAISSVSRDGILTVQTPFPKIMILEKPLMVMPEDCTGNSEALKNKR